jgi:hypothetical protein
MTLYSALLFASTPAHQARKLLFQNPTAADRGDYDKIARRSNINEPK